MYIDVEELKKWKTAELAEEAARRVIEKREEVKIAGLFSTNFEDFLDWWVDNETIEEAEVEKIEKDENYKEYVIQEYARGIESILKTIPHFSRGQKAPA